MRRLPVFFVLDCSESMVGDKIKKMEDGLQAIVGRLRTDPHALDTVYISVIAFAGVAKTIAPLLEVASFYPPKLPLGGGTNLGEALQVLMNEIDKSVIKTTPDQKGDWKPIVYLFTDGRPTSDPSDAIDRWNSKYANKATLIAVGLGKEADFSVLKRLTENVLVFDDTQEGDFTKFVNWVTASVVAHSKSVGEQIDENAIPLTDDLVVKVVKEPSLVADESCVILVGRCQKTHKPYIIKYERERQEVGTRDFKVQISRYPLAGCYPIDEDYFDWSARDAADLKVNTTELIGSPGCPHCGSATAFAVCGCGKLMCLNEPGDAVCPWCETTVSFAPGPSGEEGGFDVVRGRG